jgi:hypothetical protein
MTDHPISLSPGLWDEWIEDGCDGFLAACEAARWGADQELEAICWWLCSEDEAGMALRLRRHRRPKPPSLKEQALALLDDASDRLDAAHENTIRRALEALPD